LKLVQRRFDLALHLQQHAQIIVRLGIIGLDL
jgi:hypothetical protein